MIEMRAPEPPMGKQMTAPPLIDKSEATGRQLVIERAYRQLLIFNCREIAKSLIELRGDI